MFCLEIDIKIIKRDVVYSSFLLIIISVFIFSFFFQFLDRPSKKITMSDFNQEMSFISSIFLPHPAVYVLVC